MRKTISTLQDKDIIESVYLVREKNIGVGKNGRVFLSMVVGDVTGQIDTRAWDNVDTIKDLFDVGDLVQIKGQIQIFHNRKQLIVHKLERKEKSDFDMNEFIAQSKYNSEDLFIELVNMVNQMSNQHIKELVLSTLNDPDIKMKLHKAPAAKSIHHATIGGLIEHIVSICKIMNFFASHYTFLNKDLLIFGAIFHDLGKVWELTWEEGFQYTDRGRLLGHLYMAAELVDRKSARILGFPEELKDILKHIILSHHGKLEYGSPKRPKFLEAMLVAMVDDLDSKMDTVHGIIHTDRMNGDRWSRYSELFERYFLLDDLKRKFEE